MAINKRAKIIENLALASALGVLALIVAAISLVVDSRAVVEERSTLAPIIASAVVVSRADNPYLDRMYKIQADAGLSYAAVITLRYSSGAALVGAWFTPKGELQKLRFLGSCASWIPSTIRELVAEFPGADAAFGWAMDLARKLANGETEGQS
jgi:hypothetical protein